jgi:hypothetical protein
MFNAKSKVLTGITMAAFALAGSLAAVGNTSAAELNADSASLQAGSLTVSDCQDANLDVQLVSSLSAGGVYEVTGVEIADIDADCAGATVYAAFANPADPTTNLATATGTAVLDTTLSLTLSAPVSVENAKEIDILIENA